MVAFSVPNTIYNAVQPYATQYGVPASLWEDIAYTESGYNPSALGDQGTSFGLFQLHIGGQLPAQYVSNPQAVYSPDLNAQLAMPAIAKAWNNLKGTFNPNDLNWWENFAAQSGHPGGPVGSQANVQEAQALQRNYLSSNPTSTGYNPDPCTCCGPVGSPEYMVCHSAVAAKVGAIPACAQGCISSNQQQVPVLGGITSAFQTIGNAWNVLTSPRTWQKIGLFVFALVIVIVGITLLRKK